MNALKIIERGSYFTCNICQVDFAAGKVFKESPCSAFVLHSYTVGARTLQCKQVWLPLELNSQMLTLRIPEFQKTAVEKNAVKGVL